MRLRYSRPALLERRHFRANFDCGEPALNEYLKRYALQHQKNRASRTYASCSEDGIVAGYYSLAYLSVDYTSGAPRLTKGMPRHEIPVMLLARLGVDIRHQGKGLGRDLLRDACLRVVGAAEIAGLRALVIDAKHERAARFYRQLGFEEFESNPLKLFLLVNDIERSLR